MIGRPITGSSFLGCISYNLEDKRELTEEQKEQLSQLEGVQHKDRAEVLVYNKCFGNKYELAAQFREVALLSKRVEKPVFHFPIRLAPGDTINRDELIEIAEACVKEFEVENNQYVIILHKDTPEPHIHIIANRVGFDGKVASDSYSKRRMMDLCRRLEKQYKLREVLGPRASLPKELRLIPQHNTRKERLKVPALLADEVSFYLSRIFGWKKNEIWKESDLEFTESPAQFAYFKTPTKGNVTQIKAYSHYAYYIANIVRKANVQEPTLEYPDSLETCKKLFLSHYHNIEFENLVNFVWDMGISVVPLNDHGIFHGASWNIEDQHVIVLKQKNESHARWTFDLLHELYHVFAHLDKSNTSVIETGELNPYDNDSVEEAEANTFANQFIFETNSEDVIRKCLQLADYKIEYLKKAIDETSKVENIPADFLSNYLAFRLQMSGKNWWGTAQSFQKTTPSPSSIAARILKERIALHTIDPIDRNLLATAIDN